MTATTSSRPSWITQPSPTFSVRDVRQRRRRSACVNDRCQKLDDHSIDLTRMFEQLLHQPVRGGPSRRRFVAEASGDLVLLGEVELVLVPRRCEVELDAQPQQDTSRAAAMMSASIALR